MKKLLGFLGLVLLAGAAMAGVTNIAQVPLLNITGTGTVKPNLMLLYDNSGSMAWSYTPDYIADTTTCRNAATLADGTHGCAAGEPPYMSPDFNKQYYNPAILYRPPVRADGTSYASQDRTTTSAWTAVSIDGFGVNLTDMNGSGVGSATTINLATGFPDLKWCTSSDATTCTARNSASYVYPNATYKLIVDTRNGTVYSPRAATSNPYYYRINVAEYCTDNTLTTCKSTALNAAAPAGYPIPAKVRWCDTAKLDGNCQAKYINGSFIYPRYSSPGTTGVAAYGTITIDASAGASAMTIASVTVNDPGGALVITNGATPAASGTNAATKQNTEATDLAAQIIAKTGLARQYTACVNAPTGNNAGKVQACSSYGISLSGSNVVAVIPLDCAPTFTSKAIGGGCQPLADDSQNGWTLTVDNPSVTAQAAVPATALISVSGNTNNQSNNSKRAVLSGIALGSTQLLPNGVTFAQSSGPTTVASTIASAIGTGGNIKAYVGGNSVTPTCKSASTSTVCLVNYNDLSAGQAVSFGTWTNNAGASGTNSTGTVVLGSTSSKAGTAAVLDAIPVRTTPLGSGAAIFVRIDIVPAVTSYPKASTRTDCADTSCSYDEEMTNFANWYAYYRTRNQMMKTAVGQAFQPLNQNYNVGIVSLSDAAAQNAMTVPDQFIGKVRTDWYTALYGMKMSGSTPMRQALHAVGLMYANQGKYQRAAGTEVVKYACQPNFTLITTDGYWNGGAASDVTNNDNVENPARFCTRAGGCVDTRDQSVASLADVALYWYNGGSATGTSSLAPLLEDMTKPGLVPARAGENTHLHMNTYALGLGVDGLMTYEPNYDTAPTTGGDFYRLITGATTGCPWNNNGKGPYVWPDPATGDSNGGASYQSRVDDLWHSAINGHGKYFSASDPAAVVASLNSALSNIQVRIGAAAAAATSTPNISLEDNDIFSATFTTVRWNGEITDRKIDPLTGEVGTKVSWSSTDKLGGLTALDSSGKDGRTIYMQDVKASDGTPKAFAYGSLYSDEQAWFASKCSALPQCVNLSATDRAIVDDGNNIVNWLRGQQKYADGTRLRAYTMSTPAGNATAQPIVLGDVVSAKPAYQRDPRKGYTMNGYQKFRTDNASRKGVVFAAANDGMLHAFAASDGTEMWAYAPRITMSKLYLQASTNYALNHQFTTDGSPEIGDVYFNSAWHSVLVAGLNGGGRGYYALDITDPTKPPKVLWEICADPAVCSGTRNLPNLGLTFGNPQFGTFTKKSDNSVHWAVFLTSGYNNVPNPDGTGTGDGYGYLYVVDVATGEILSTSTTGKSVGGADNPSGLAKITAITANPNTDPQVTYVYGGDNLGNMWRFDFTSPGDPPAPTLMGGAGTAQPITSRPEVTTCAVTTTDQSGNSSTNVQRFVAFGTGRMLDVSDLSTKDKQSVYVLKDSGTAIASGDWRATGKMAQRTLTKTTSAAGDSFTIGGANVSLGSQLGWFFDLDAKNGERVNLDPKVVAGTLNVVTNVPSSSSTCAVGGTSNVYQLNVCTGAAVAVDNSSGTAVGIAGHTLSNVSAAVGYIIVRLPSGALKMITTLADGSTITSGVTGANSSAPHRAGWREVQE